MQRKFMFYEHLSRNNIYAGISGLQNLVEMAETTGVSRKDLVSRKFHILLM